MFLSFSYFSIIVRICFFSHRHPSFLFRSPSVTHPLSFVYNFPIPLPLLFIVSVMHCPSSFSLTSISCCLFRFPSASPSLPFSLFLLSYILFLHPSVSFSSLFLIVSICFILYTFPLLSGFLK